MQTIVKKWISLLAAMCIVSCVFVINTLAAGSSSITRDGNLFVADDEITVTARFCTYAYKPMYKVEGYITYDPRIVEFVSGDNCDLITDGKIKVVIEASGKTVITQSVVFRALTTGLTKVTLENVRCFDSKGAYKTAEGSETSITVINPSETASDNANLRNLRVSHGMLIPSFSRDVTSYEVAIPSDCEELLLSVGTEHVNSTYVIEGSKLMDLGINKRDIIVTSENGTQKVYTVKITRLDAGENAPESDSLLLLNSDRVRVVIDDKPFYIEESFAPEVIPSGFRQETYVYRGIEFPCVTDDNLVMLYLTDFDNTESAFYVVSDAKTFTKITTINIDGEDYHIIPVKGDEVPNGYTKTSVTIGDKEFSAFKSVEEKLSDFILFYAKDSSGNIGFYRYDTLENSLQRADGMGITFGKTEEDTVPETFVDFIKNLNTKGTVVMICISATVVILIITIIVLVVKIATARRNEIMAEDDDYDDEDFFDINFIMTVDKDDK